MDSIGDEERRIIEALDRLQDNYRRAAEPYLKRLVQISELKTPPVVVMDGDNWLFILQQQSLSKLD